mmetsp:Transcript_129520/g.360848  ORF Transcript_129520/g.360848 Transcript_129520/m.360848 type:complete len:202 (+) Transcript_129520:517-1122(+)
MRFVGPAMTLVPVSNAAWQPGAAQSFSLTMSTATSLSVTCHMPVRVFESCCQKTSPEPRRSFETAPNAISPSSSSASVDSQTAKRLLSKAPVSARTFRKLKRSERDAPGRPRPSTPSYGSKPKGSSDISVASTRPVRAQSWPSGPKQTMSSSGTPTRVPLPTGSSTPAPCPSAPFVLGAPCWLETLPPACPAVALAAESYG